MGRPELGAGDRLVLKVGTASLVDATGRPDDDRLATLCSGIAELKSSGVDVILVSSGAIAAGLTPLGLSSRPSDIPSLQAAAAVGQGRLLARYARLLGDHDHVAAQLLLTQHDFMHRQQYLNARNTLDRLLSLGAVPIVNENDTVATDEIRFGDNDRLAALVAHLVHADLLVLLSDVDGLYDGQPGKPGTRLIEVVRDASEVEGLDIAHVSSSKVGTGGMVTKVEAARIATAAGIPVVLTSAANAGIALAGDKVGTRFEPTGRRRPTRLLWLAHASETKGGVHLDEGAVRALTMRKASLLPAGITEVTGSFKAGDPIDVIGPDGTVIARGVVNYDSTELPALLGRSTHEIAAELGEEYEREVIHRDDLMLT